MDGFTEFTLENIKTPEGIAKLNDMLRKLFEHTPGDGESIRDFTGYGTPEGAITAGIGSTYRRIDGGSGTSFYVKQSGTGNTGWAGK